MKHLKKSGLICIVVLVSMIISTVASARTVIDALGRKVNMPDKVERVICSGSGCLRLLTYLQAQGMAVAVDDIEKRTSILDARPYAMANPQFKKLPLFGEFRGHDNPELIVGLNPQPQVILKTYTGAAQDPKELEAKTGLPVVVLNYGDLGSHRGDLDQALTIMGQVVGRDKRAKNVIGYINGLIMDLNNRTKNNPRIAKTSCYVGGIAQKGPHGFQSTEPEYPPFSFINVKNVAAWTGPGKAPEVSTVAKEKIIEWNPDILFLDLSTLRLGDKSGGLFELKTDPAYRSLSGVQKGNVYGLLPYNWYTTNFGSVLANAYFVGKTLAPEAFADVNPQAKADEIYSFLVGAKVFSSMNKAFQNMVYAKIPLK